jgi:nucleoside-diphosphate-sugar epimerase
VYGDGKQTRSFQYVSDLVSEYFLFIHRVLKWVLFILCLVVVWWCQDS